MKKGILLLLIITTLYSCKETAKKEVFKPSFNNLTIDTLLQDEISIRAITLDGDRIWYAGNNGKYGAVSLTGKKAFIGSIAKDSLHPEFRAIAQTDKNIFILSVANPALLYKITKNGKKNNIVYTEEGEAVFYNSMQFVNDTEGYAVGDPVDGCLSVITTKDGGNTWNKISCDVLPKAENGEAGFAASNTNLIVKENKIWIVTGGKRSRIFYSPDKGIIWKTFNTPIIQGETMTGVFSIDFYDERIGFVVGGNYEKPELKTKNKALTLDGGKTWKLVAEDSGFGYASCVQFIPESKGNEIVTVGTSGMFYSYDRGLSWKKIMNDNTIHTIRFINNKTIIAAGQNKIIRIVLN